MTDYRFACDGGRLVLQVRDDEWTPPPPGVRQFGFGGNRADKWRDARVSDVGADWIIGGLRGIPVESLGREA